MRADEFVESYIDAWNHCDPVAIANHFVEGGIYCDVPENVRRSRSELIVNLTEFFSLHRHRYELIGEILTSNDTIAYQYRMYAPDESGQRPASEAIRINLPAEINAGKYAVYNLNGELILNGIILAFFMDSKHFIEGICI